MSKTNFVELEPLNKNLGKSAMINIDDIAVANYLTDEDKKMFKAQTGVKCLFRCGAVICFSMPYEEFRDLLKK